MDLENSFTVHVPVERAWQVLTDVPTIAPCLPGAQLQEVVDDEFRGVVKVKVGPIVAQYKGKATFEEQDEAERRLVLRAEGRETRGQGNASALITARLEPSGSSTHVVVSTDLTVTGKVAQFGRGVMADVSAKLMDQFADNLAATVLTGTDEAGGADAGTQDAGTAGEGGRGPEGSEASGTDGAGGNGSAPPGTSSHPGPGAEPEPIDLLGTAGAPAARRLLPPIVAVVVAVLLIRYLIRRRHS